MCNVSIFSSNYWLISWVVMELVSFSFLSILAFKEGGIASKVILWKYFLLQSFGSMIFFVSMIMMNSSFMSTFFLVLSMFIKMGFPPFHKWMLEMSDTISWFNFFLLGSIQKIIPLYFIWSVKCHYVLYLGVFMIFFSVFSLFDWSVRRFLVYSSIVNMSWIVMSSAFSTLTFLLSFLMYSLTLTSVVLILSDLKLSEFFSIFMLGKNWSIDLNFFMAMNFFSLMGIPPFGGFLMKYDILVLLIKNDLFLLASVILFFTLIMVFMYLYIFILFFYSSNIFNYYLRSKPILVLVTFMQSFWLFVYFY